MLILEAFMLNRAVLLWRGYTYIRLINLNIYIGMQ